MALINLSACGPLNSESGVLVLPLKLRPGRTASPNNEMESSKVHTLTVTARSMPSSTIPKSISADLTHDFSGPMTQQPSSSKYLYPSPSVSSFLPSSITTEAVLTTSLLFGITAPPKTITNSTTTSVCTTWSGVGCPGDICYAQTCKGVLLCWDGRCCMTACSISWECTGECADGLSCSKAVNSAIGRCTTTHWISVRGFIEGY